MGDPRGHGVGLHWALQGGEQGQGGGRALQVTSSLGFGQADGPLKALPGSDRADFQFWKDPWACLGRAGQRRK